MPSKLSTGDLEIMRQMCEMILGLFIWRTERSMVIYYAGMMMLHRGKSQTPDKERCLYELSMQITHQKRFIEKVMSKDQCITS